MTHAEPRKFVFSVALAALFVASAGGLAQASVVWTFGANNAQLEAKATVGFDGFGSVAADFTSIAPPAVATDPPAPSHFSTTASASILPASSSVGKDKAEVTCTTIFDYGVPVGSGVSDQIAFDVVGTVSAVDARNIAGNPAAAVATAKGKVKFFLDALYGGVAPGTVVGYLGFPALRGLLPGEVLLTVHVTQEISPAIPVDVLTMNAGDPNATAPLYAGAAYLITLDYMAKAPFGTDPPFSVGYTVGVNTPEPATLSLLALGGLAALLRRRAA